MRNPEQLINRLVVNETLTVQGESQLYKTTVRGDLIIGDTMTQVKPSVQLLGDLTVDGKIKGQLTDIIQQINASEGLIVPQRIDGRLLEDVHHKLARATMISQAAISMAIIALLIAVVLLII